MEKFFTENDDIKPFNEVLDENHLTRLLIQTRLQLGKEYSDARERLGTGVLDELISRREITLSRHNQKYFGENDVVRIEADFKNIQKYSVNVYKINLENYYKENLAPFDQTLSFEGIVPLERQEVVCKEISPLLKVRQSFEF